MVQVQLLIPGTNYWYRDCPPTRTRRGGSYPARNYIYGRGIKEPYTWNILLYPAPILARDRGIRLFGLRSWNRLHYLCEDVSLGARGVWILALVEWNKGISNEEPATTTGTGMLFPGSETTGTGSYLAADNSNCTGRGQFTSPQLIIQALGALLLVRLSALGELKIVQVYLPVTIHL